MKPTALRFVLGLALAFVAVSLVPTEAFAGNCTSFCRNLTPRQNGSVYVTQIVGNSCSAAAECRVGPPCTGDTVTASPETAREFCQSALSGALLLTAEELRATSWCRDLLNTDRAQTHYDGRCLIIPPGARPSDLNSDPVVSPTPVPAPFRPGDTFRCRFLCAGDSQARDGGSCSAATDQATCVAECRRTCQAVATGPEQACLGLQMGGRVSAVLTDMERAPQCIPTTGPSPSVAGLTDTQRFETINETFANLSIPVFIGNLIKALLGVVGALFLALLVWAGLQWMTAGGDSAQVKGAQTTARNAILGVAIIALSYTMLTAFMQVVAEFAGLGS